MKRILTAALVASVGLFSLGCTSGSPGGATNNDRPVVGNAEGTFTVSTPNTSTSIKQGESKVIDLGIKRGKNFSEDVALKLEGLPKGVTADPAAPTIKAGEEGAKVTLKADGEAALGDFTVKVVGHPTKGGDAANQFKLTVDKK